MKKLDIYLALGAIAVSLICRNWLALCYAFCWAVAEFQRRQA